MRGKKFINADVQVLALKPKLRPGRSCKYFYTRNLRPQLITHVRLQVRMFRFQNKLAYHSDFQLKRLPLRFSDIWAKRHLRKWHLREVALTYLELVLPVMDYHRWLMTGRTSFWTSFWLTELRGKGAKLGEGKALSYVRGKCTKLGEEKALS
jgi:hypothetical protein